MSPPKVTLQVVAGPHRGETRQFRSHDTLLVGRAENAHLRLPEDLHFSRNHFRVEVKPPECHLVDLESSNGTFVNGKRVSDTWLRDGDTISGGRTEIRVRVEGADANQMTQEYDLVGHPLEHATVATVVAKDTLIPNHELIHELGSGSMGVVYYARALDTGQEVAIKLIQPGVHLDETTIQTFLREGKILKRLRHKRIIRFVDTGVADGSLFLSMEYVDAIPLEETLAGLKFADRVRVSCGLARQVLDGLDYAHKQNLVHRDVKPKNVLVSKGPNGLSAKLADFGLAKNFMDAGLSQISGENEIKGTLCYMPPEQVASCRYAKPQVDIFALGATLYTWISGKMIYNLEDHRTPLAAVLNSGPIPISDRVDLDPDLVAVVQKSLSPDASDRYQTASEMRTALKPFCQ